MLRLSSLQLVDPRWTISYASIVIYLVVLIIGREKYEIVLRRKSNDKWFGYR